MKVYVLHDHDEENGTTIHGATTDKVKAQMYSIEHKVLMNEVDTDTVDGFVPSKKCYQVWFAVDESNEQMGKTYRLTKCAPKGNVVPIRVGSVELAYIVEIWADDKEQAKILASGMMAKYHGE